MDWQPIATAPKDGTIVLVVRRTTVTMAAWGGTKPPCWKEGSKLGRSLWGQPSHWQPLPEPPTE